MPPVVSRRDLARKESVAERGCIESDEISRRNETERPGLE
jgi:hypothetical protein